MTRPANLDTIPYGIVRELSTFLEPATALSLSRVNHATQNAVRHYWRSVLPHYITNHFRCELNPYELPAEQFTRLYIAESRHPHLAHERVFSAHADGCQSVIMGKDGQWALSKGRNGVIKLWDVKRKECRLELNREEAIWQMSRDGKRAFSIDDRGGNLWDLTSGKIVGHIPLQDADGMPLNIQHLHTSDDGKRVLYIYPKVEEGVERGSVLKLLNVDTGEELCTMTSDIGYANAVMSGNGERAFVHLRNKSPELWDLTREECIWTPEWFSDLQICSYETHDSDKLFIRFNNGLGGREGDSYMWLDLTSGSATPAPKLEGACEEDFAIFEISSDGTKAITSTRRSFQHWDLTTGACLHTRSPVSTTKVARVIRIAVLGYTIFPTNVEDREMHAKITPNGKNVISLSMKGSLQLRDLSTGKLLDELRQNERMPHLGLSIDSYGTEACSISQNGQITIYNIAPLPEESLCEVSENLHTNVLIPLYLLRKLPRFVQRVLPIPESFQSVTAATPDRKNRALAKAISRDVNIYLGKMVLPKIAEVFHYLATTPPTAAPTEDEESTSSLSPASMIAEGTEARIANLPKCIKQAIYHEIVLEHAKADKLPPNRPHNYGKLAFHNQEGHTATLAEKRTAVLAVWEKIRRLP